MHWRFGQGIATCVRSSPIHTAPPPCSAPACAVRPPLRRVRDCRAAALGAKWDRGIWCWQCGSGTSSKHVLWHDGTEKWFVGVEVAHKGDDDGMVVWVADGLYDLCAKCFYFCLSDGSHTHTPIKWIYAMLVDATSQYPSQLISIWEFCVGWIHDAGRGEWSDLQHVCGHAGRWWCGYHGTRDSLILGSNTLTGMVQRKCMRGRAPRSGHPRNTNQHCQDMSSSELRKLWDVKGRFI